MRSAVARRLAPAWPAVHRFHDLGKAAAAIAAHAEALRGWAAARRARGLTVSDQDRPDEAFCLLPPRTTRPPLLLLGGMGPLAGAFAFRRACQRFGGTRAIVLYQACSVPDRTDAILADTQGRRPGTGRAVVRRMAEALAAAAELLPAASGRADTIVVCNSAHYFWEPLRQRLAGVPALAGRLRLLSLVTCAVDALRALAGRPVLLLCTEGSRAGGVFARAAAHAGVQVREPEADPQRWLTRAIYDGVKALDDRRAVAFGTRFFERAQADAADCEGVLAGCTELPPLLALLKAHGTAPVAAFLARVTVVDPLEAALDARHA